MTEANEHGDHQAPRWFQEYKFSDFTDDLSPAGIDALLEKMAANPDVLRKVCYTQCSDRRVVVK